MAKLISFIEPFDFTGYTLVIPSVSVGNVGQLAVDLLITTFNLKKVATIWHPGIIPLAAGNPYQEDDEPCTACELYGNKKLNIGVIQLRSSVEFKLALDFFDLLKTDIQNLKFSNVVILTSKFAYELHNIESSHFFYITNSDTKFENLNVLPMVLNEMGKYTANGCGFAIKLFEILQPMIKCTIFIKYVSEGDNRPDAIAMVNIIKKVLNIPNDDFNIKMPISWNHVFGNPPPVGIF